MTLFTINIYFTNNTLSIHIFHLLSFPLFLLWVCQYELPGRFGDQPLVSNHQRISDAAREYLWWPLMEDNLWWRSTFTRGQPTIEDKLQWKINFDGKLLTSRFNNKNWKTGLALICCSGFPTYDLFICSSNLLYVNLLICWSFSLTYNLFIKTSSPSKPFEVSFNLLIKVLIQWFSFWSFDPSIHLVVFYLT